ncbi:PQQ-dependent sugar dehydrogenase [Alkalimonas sp. NCh-2]|uniref:PQQ-dependent sugar dehydrogenase n=1 Tax=Alkalimonas sp. NCh-2 TaxID=3144846 RepID=UPI0031F64AD5
MKNTLFGLLLALTLSSFQTLADSSPVTSTELTEPAQFTGAWYGYITMPNTELLIIVTLEYSDNHWSGTFVVPSQSATGTPLENFSVSDNQLAFSTPSGSRFEGQLDDNQRLQGTFTQGTVQRAVNLGREVIDPNATVTLTSRWGNIDVETFASGLVRPWGLDFLDNGRILVTELPGRLRIVEADGSLGAPIAGVPAVNQINPAGLFDVVLAPDFATSQRIYLSWAKPDAAGSNAASTSIAHARLADGALHDFTEIFSAYPKVPGWHYGGRMVFSADGQYLFLGLGDRGDQLMQSQELGSHTGTLIRIHPDGSVPADNPFIHTAGALPEIYSYGHRNIQGLGIQPGTNRLWATEHGPQGGDEVNTPEPGKNYGWPIITHGEAYGGGEIPLAVGFKKEGMEQPVWHWTPSIGVSGMTFYQGESFPAWQGNILAVGLRDRNVARLEIDGDRVIHQENLQLKDRIREVKVGPDGFVYLLTDEQGNGKILRLRPAQPQG